MQRRIRGLSRALVTLVILVAVVSALFFAWTYRPEIAAISPPEPSSFDHTKVARGAELAMIGNCNSCHTVEGGETFAGGRALQTPFGTIYGTNITPDPETGIGQWSEAAFARALHEGVDRDGNHLYPAFPYDHFTRLSDADVSALYAYVMTRTPVRETTPDNDLPFPLNLRPLLAGWKLLFFRPGRFVPDATRTADQNGGAYLVEALAHCGACHTPRGALGAEESSQRFAGGSSDGWTAPALNTHNPSPVPWTPDDLVAYLRAGYAADHGASAGPMLEVSRNLARAPDADVRRIAGYIADQMGRPSRQQRDQRARDLLAQAAGRPVPERETTGSSTAGATDVAALYAGACGSCHDNARLGATDALDLSFATAVRLSNPQNFLHVVLEGMHPREPPAAALMPGFSGTLTDQQIAQLAEYVRKTFSGEPAWRDVEGALADIRKNNN